MIGDLPDYGSDIDPMFSSEMHQDRRSNLYQFMNACGISMHDPSDRRSAHEEMKRIEHEYIFNPKKG